MICAAQSQRAVTAIIFGCPVPATEDRGFGRTCIERTREGTMIEKVGETWVRFLAGELPEAVDGLLADDVVFYSPIVAESD